MTKDKIFELIDSHRKEMEAVLDFMENHAATGYEEWEASDYLADLYEKLGYTLTRAGNIPGFYTDIDTGKPGPKVLVFSELDGLTIPDHPHANPKNGAAHGCGHHAQCAALYGVAAALKNPEVLEGLSGSIRLCVVPAEEGVRASFIKELVDKGIVKLSGGKREFYIRGYFDDCDLAFMIHTGGGTHKFSIRPGCNGGIKKEARFVGKNAHAGAPRHGINALQAANLALSSINVLRDTFNNYDFVRVSSILTEAGTAVNIIPGTSVLETQVRANKVEICRDINKKVTRAIAASAASIGAKVHITDMPGYLPGAYDKNLIDVMIEGMEEVVGAGNAKYITEPWDTGCTDMGDISQIMPAVHAFGSGAVGAGHGPTYRIADFDSACMDSAKAQVMILRKLLENDASKAKFVIENSNVHFKNKEEYISFIEALFTEKEAVVYNEDGTVLLDI
ncbi:MAG: amidohydrolase [Ruminococcaceae bacterium]|nr:amidohydrolase [Oscillospiraceae bacterium]